MWHTAGVVLVELFVVRSSVVGTQVQRKRSLILQNVAVVFCVVTDFVLSITCVDLPSSKLIRL